VGSSDAEPSKLLHTVTRSLREALRDLQQKALHNSEELLRQEAVIRDLQRQLAAKSALIEDLTAALLEQGRCGASGAAHVAAAAEGLSEEAGVKGGADKQRPGERSAPSGFSGDAVGPASPCQPASAIAAASLSLLTGGADGSRGSVSSSAVGDRGHAHETSSDAESSETAQGGTGSNASTACSVGRAAAATPSACAEPIACMLQRAEHLAVCIVSALGAEVRCDCSACHGKPQCGERAAGPADTATAPAATGEELGPA
jgi:hypothetical protein